jgi:hypothetical protein
MYEVCTKNTKHFAYIRMRRPDRSSDEKHTVGKKFHAAVQYKFPDIFTYKELSPVPYSP